MPKAYYNLAEAAERLEMTTEKLKAEVRSKRIPLDAELGDKWAFSVAAIEFHRQAGQWPSAYPDPAEVAELVVQRLVEIQRAGLEAQLRSCDPQPDIDALVSLRKVG